MEVIRLRLRSHDGGFVGVRKVKGHSFGGRQLKGLLNVAEVKGQHNFLAVVLARNFFVGASQVQLRREDCKLSGSKLEDCAQRSFVNVNADAGMFRQIMINLIKNAIEAEAQKIVIALINNEETSHNQPLTLYVGNDGMPIPADLKAFLAINGMAMNIMR